MTTPTHSGLRPRPVWGSAALAMLAISLGGCRGVFEATNRDVVSGDQIERPAVQAALLAGVAHDFATAYDFLITNVGVVSDELVTSGTWANYTVADQQGTFVLDDQNVATGNIAEANWNSLHAARVAAERLYASVDASGGVAGNAVAAQARLYSGMSYLFLGELTCDVAVDGGPATPAADAIRTAEAQLTEAITIADAVGAAQARTGQLARLMRARARLALGNGAGAAADARLVPDGFTFAVNPVVSGGQGWTWVHVNSFPTATVGSAFRSTGDPRSAVTTRAGAGGITLYVPNRYARSDSPLPLGSWQEARLIEAEVVLAASDTGRAVALLNQVRAAASLPALAAGMSPSAVLDALKRERRNELFLTGRRLQDMQRFGEVPPEYRGATPFAKLCIPVPQTERDNNPNLGTVHATRS